MPPNASAIRKRNVLWPIQRGAKGWETGVLAERYRSAIRNLLRTPIGSIIWAPTFGTRLHQFRTQSINDDEQTLLAGELEQSVVEWISDIVVISFDFGIRSSASAEPGARPLSLNPDSETLDVLVVWGIPDAGGVGARAGKPKFAFGPVQQTVTI